MAELGLHCEGGWYRHVWFPPSLCGVEGVGKLTYKLSRCQFGAPPVSCRQLATPVIFPHFWSVDFQSRIVCCETRNSPCLPPSGRAVRLRQHLRDALHGARDSRRSVRQVPPVLHRQAEADGYGRARGALPPEIRDGEGRRLTRGGPTPPGARTGGGGRPGAGRPRDRAESR